MSYVIQMENDNIFQVNNTTQSYAKEVKHIKKLEEKTSEIEAWSQIEGCLHLSTLMKTKRKTEHKVSDISWNALKLKEQHTYSKFFHTKTFSAKKKDSYIISKLYQKKQNTKLEIFFSSPIYFLLLVV